MDESKNLELKRKMKSILEGIWHIDEIYDL